MPVSTRALIEQIKTHEGHAEVAGKIDPKNKVGNSKYGTYKGVGRVEYSKEGVTPEMAKEAGLEDLYGKEIVTGYGHALLGQELRDYFTDPKKRDYWDNLSQEDAEELLNKDVKKHQKYTDELLEQNKINPKDLSREQYNCLVELTFQLGKSRFEEFTNFWDYASEGNWEEAAKELKYGKTREEFSDFWNHSKGMRSRIKTYMKNLSPSQEQSTIIQSPSKEVPANQAGGFRFSDYYSDVVDTLLPKAYADTSSGDQSYFESLGLTEKTKQPTNEGKETPSAGNYFESLGLNKETRVPEEEVIEENVYEPGVIEDVASPSQPLKSSEDLLKEMSSPSQFLYSPETSTSPAPSSPPPTMSQGEAATRGLVHGGTFGLAKKAAGGANWLGEGMGRMYGEGGLEGAIKRSAEGKPPIKTPDSFRAEDYQSGQKAYQKKLDEAKDDWAKTVFASELLGGSFLPGSIALKGASTAKRLLGATAAGGIEGGIYAGAESEAQDLPTLARDIGLGIAYGAGAGAALGGTIAGGAKLYDKIKGVKPEEVVTSKLLDREVVDLALDAAEKRARDEAEFNIEMLKTIKSFSSKSPEEQIKFLNVRPAEVKKVLSEWAQTMDPKALRSYGSRQLDSIPPSIKTMAKKQGLDPKIVFAYYNWRNDVSNYVKYVNDIGARTSKTKDKLLKEVREAGTLGGKTIQKELPAFKKNIKAGIATPESYNQYKMQQYLAEELQQLEDVRMAAASVGYDAADKELIKAVEDEARDIIVKDPMKNWGMRKFSTVTNAAEVIDDKAKTKVLDTVQDLYVADKKKSGFTSAVSDVLEPVLKMRNKGKYADMTDEDIVRMIESGNDDTLADGYRKVFTKIRELANEAGVKIDEYKFGQDKYVPMKRKGAAELIEAMESKWKELESLNLDKDVIDKILRDKKVNLPEETLKDVNYLKSFLEDVYNRPILTADLMSRAVGDLRNKDSIRQLVRPSVRNVHERHGDLPMWARETDLGKMATIDAGSIGDLIYKRPVLDRLDTQIMLLKMKGFDNSYQYLTNLKKDILGIPREGTEKRQYKSIIKELSRRNSKVGKLVGGLENAFATAIYPNYLGLNPRAFVRNLTQPYTMTTRELGVGIPGDVLAFNSTMKVMANPKKAMKKYSELGLLDVRNPKPADFEGLKSGLSSYFKNNKWARRFDRFLDGYSDAVMKMYTTSDTINRLVTAQMSEDIAKLLKAGKTKWLKNAPDQVKNKIQSQLDEGANIDELTLTIGKWLQTKTQLSYSKDDMYEFGREMGPMFAMLSKWPTSVTSDVATKIMKDGKAGAARAASKYLAPFALFSLAQNFADTEIDPKTARSRAMFGYGGLNTWMPMSSLWSITDAALPIPADSLLEQGQNLTGLAGEALSGRWDDRDSKMLLKNIEKLGTQFLPVAGSVIKTKKTIEDLSGKTDKDKAKKKRKKRKRYFD